MTTFNSNLESLNVGMNENNYDRYKLLALYKKEFGVSAKRGARLADVVQAIIDNRKQEQLP